MGDNARTLEFRPTTLELLCASCPGTQWSRSLCHFRVAYRSARRSISASTPDTASTVAGTAKPNACTLIGQPFEALGN
jgi:hypothetical protein